jgi:hypothetical protein
VTDPFSAVVNPPLHKFEQCIEKYRALQTEIGHLASTVDVGCLRVDTKPVKSVRGHSVA